MQGPLLGAGETVELTARLLADDGVKQILFANRSPEKAKALPTHFHGWTVPWEERAKAFGDVDIVLSATGSTEPVVTAAMLKPVLVRGRRPGPLLILDLAVPRDIQTKVDDFSDAARYDMDALGELACDNTRDRMADVPHAERIVEESTQKFLGWLAGLAHADTLEDAPRAVRQARRDEIERYSGKLSRLSPDPAVVPRMTETLLEKILHNPTIGLKEGDASERLTRAAVVRALFELDDGPYAAAAAQGPPPGKEERL